MVEEDAGVIVAFPNMVPGEDTGELTPRTRQRLAVRTSTHDVEREALQWLQEAEAERERRAQATMALEAHVVSTSTTILTPRSLSPDGCLDPLHRSQHCEVEGCACTFFFGGRHHCRGCSKSVCSDHFQRPLCTTCADLRGRVETDADQRQRAIDMEMEQLRAAAEDARRELEAAKMALAAQQRELKSMHTAMAAEMRAHEKGLVETPTRIDISRARPEGIGAVRNNLDFEAIEEERPVG